MLEETVRNTAEAGITANTGDHQKRVTSGYDGSFELTDLEPATYTVTASLLGDLFKIFEVEFRR